MGLCVECVELYTNKRKNPDRPPGLDGAIRLCEMVCPICTELVCDEEDAARTGVEIACGCTETWGPDEKPYTRVWHSDCFVAFAKFKLKLTGKENDVGPVIIHCGVGHKISIAPQNILENRELISLGPPADLILEYLKVDPDHTRAKRLKVERDVRVIGPASPDEVGRKASEERATVEGMAGFLDAFYCHLLPDVLRGFGHLIGATYSLKWYPSSDDGVNMGYYGDEDFEWRPVSPPKDTPPCVPPRDVPPSSSKVQLRFKKLKGLPWPLDHWEGFRTALRTRLACRCSRVWQYKLATYEWVEDVVREEGEEVGGTIKYTALEQSKQTHESDTCVLTLDLSDLITRCKKSGASTRRKVEDEIEREKQEQAQMQQPPPRPTEDSLGEPLDDDGHTFYVIVDEEEEEQEEEEEEEEKWWGGFMQLQLFRETEEVVIKKVRDPPTAGVETVCNDVLEILTIRIRQKLNDYASGAYGRVLFYVPKFSVRVQGRDEDTTLTLNEFPFDIGPTRSALLSAFFKDRWVKIDITREDIEDTDEPWNMFVQEFQHQLVTKLVGRNEVELGWENYDASNGPYGVLYTVRPDCTEDLNGCDLVVVKTTCTPRSHEISRDLTWGPISRTSSPKLEILVFWWNDEDKREGDITQKVDFQDFVVLDDVQRRRWLNRLKPAETAPEDP